MTETKHILKVRDFSKDRFLNLFKLAEEIRSHLEPGKKYLMDGYEAKLKRRIMATLFWEPSTRTRMSFEAAMMHQGGRILGGFTAQGSSAAKGETIPDTTRTVCSLGVSVIVMRHLQEGAAKLAAEYAEEYNVSIINGGDGSHEHPTQTLLDLYTMYLKHGDMKNKNVAVVGDLKYGRTPHSLIYGLGVFGANVTLVSPDELKMPEHYITKFESEFGRKIAQVSKLEDVLESSDVIYMTRIQKERFPSLEEYQKVAKCFQMDAAMADRMPENSITMHPLPRVDEIKLEVDKTKQAYYFIQAQNGWIVRAALLQDLLLE